MAEIFSADSLIRAFGDQAYHKGVKMAVEALNAGDLQACNQINQANIELMQRGYHKKAAEPLPSTAPHWNLSEALGMYRKLISVFYGAGYTLVLYGSAVSKHGPARDLDLMAIPWRPCPTPPKFVFDEVCSRFSLSPNVGEPYLGVMRTWVKTASDRQGRILDFCFHRSDVTLEDSYRFSMRQEIPSTENTEVKP